MKKHRTRYFPDCNCESCCTERILREPLSGNWNSQIFQKERKEEIFHE
jgi:hypothetical protein